MIPLTANNQQPHKRATQAPKNQPKPPQSPDPPAEAAPPQCPTKANSSDPVLNQKQHRNPQIPTRMSHRRRRQVFGAKVHRPKDQSTHAEGNDQMQAEVHRREQNRTKQRRRNQPPNPIQPAQDKAPKERLLNDGAMITAPTANSRRFHQKGNATTSTPSGIGTGRAQSQPIQGMISQ